ALLLAGAAMVNVTAGFSFALLAANHASVTSVVRYFIAHMAATMSAATFVFCLLVAIRALVGLLSRGRVAIASVLQFTLISASLCLIVLVPTAFKVSGGGRRGPARVMVQAVPDWSPPSRCLGPVEVLRRSRAAELNAAALRGLVVTAP